MPEQFENMETHLVQAGSHIDEQPYALSFLGVHSSTDWFLMPHAMYSFVPVSLLSLRIAERTNIV